MSALRPCVKALEYLLLLALVMPVASCAQKGKLKSPAQIQNDEAKKAKRAAQENGDDDTATPADNTNLPAPAPTPAPRPPTPADIPPSIIATPAQLPGAQ